MTGLIADAARRSSILPEIFSPRSEATDCFKRARITLPSIDRVLGSFLVAGRRTYKKRELYTTSFIVILGNSVLNISP